MNTNCGGGDSWDAKIRQQIRECALFLPVISQQTDARVEGYFRREWRLAVDRTHDMAEGIPFLLPIVIDDTHEGAALVPGAFRDVQWVNLPHGLPGPEFVDTVQRLLNDEPGEAASAATRGPSISRSQASTAKAKIPSWALGLVAIILVGGGAYWLGQSRDAGVTAPAPAATPVSTESIVAAVPESNSLSIAVMPFVNMSSNTENEYFAGGVHEDVLTNLTHIDGMEVVSRTTALRIAAEALTLRQIGERLQVRYVVEGSVRRIGNHVRVTVQLIDARNDCHLWASNFERELIDVFATQSELAKQISDSLHLEIQPETVGQLSDMSTKSVRAYDLFLKAASIEKTEDTTEDNLRRQIELLEEAVQIDPEFVEAWAVLKRRYDYMAHRVLIRDWLAADGSSPEERRKVLWEKSARAMAKAEALDPDNLETKLARAMNHIWPQSELVMAEQKALLDEILSANPDHAMAWYHLGWWYRHLEPIDDAGSMVALEEALKHDPFNARIVRAVLECYRQLLDEPNVERLAQRLTQIVPELAEGSELTNLPINRRVNALRTAFRLAVVTDFQRLFDNSENWANQNPHMKLWAERHLRCWEDDWDRVVAIADDWSAVAEGSAVDASGSWIWTQLTAAGHWRLKGDLPKAQYYARRALAELQSERIQRLYDHEGWVSSDMTTVHYILGNEAEMMKHIEHLEAMPEDRLTSIVLDKIRGLSLVALDRAVDLAFEQDPTESQWLATDAMAVWCRSFPSFVNHPRMREYYIKEGQWLPYLAKRLPEYAEYAKPTNE